MNILIVGNGFDLSHYLPTKYDYFMDVMGAIAKKDTGGSSANLENTKLEVCLEQIDKMFEKRKGFEPPPHHMNFDELFAQTRDPNFIEKTKEYYLTENIEICSKDVLKLQYRLEMNCWYRYFKSHVEEIKTWIDFEQKIEEVLIVVARCLTEMSLLHTKDSLVRYLTGSKNEKSIREKDLMTLNLFNFSIKNTSGVYHSNSLNNCFCYGESIENGFNPSSFLDFLYQQLEEFIKIFDLYLELVVSQLAPNRLAEINSEDWVYPDKVFSFNYTNTFQRIHDSVDVDYLHGSHGEDQNIVLGISDIEDEGLKKLKVFGFTKYQQKLFKDTDYQFLDGMRHVAQLKSFWRNDGHRAYTQAEVDKNQLNISIWGHSLDYSDREYIQEIFSFNDAKDEKVRVLVYYFDKNAQFSLLNNLLAILGKDKVEQWMKNKWLCFKPNPEVKFEVDSNLEEAS